MVAFSLTSEPDLNTVCGVLMVIVNVGFSGCAT